MDDATPAALRTALDYYQAWSTHDFDQAMILVAPDVVCHAPAGRIDGADGLRGFMGPFSQMTTESRLVGSFGDDDTALLMYVPTTTLVGEAPGAEHYTVVDGLITEIMIIFDRAPFQAARPPSPAS